MANLMPLANGRLVCASPAMQSHVGLRCSPDVADITQEPIVVQAMLMLPPGTMHGQVLLARLLSAAEHADEPATGLQSLARPLVSVSLRHITGTPCRGGGVDADARRLCMGLASASLIAIGFSSLTARTMYTLRT